MRQVFPDSEIIPNRTGNFPIKVIIVAGFDDGKTVQVWSGKQQKLFAKNRSKRIKAMDEIKVCLEGLKEGSETSTEGSIESSL